MVLHTLAAIIVVLLVSVKCDDSVETERSHRDVVKAINTFSNSLYKVLRETPGNFVVSPFSVETVLAMVLLGLRGATAQQVSSALHLPDSHLRVEQGFKSLLGSLQASQNVTLDFANKIYFQKGFHVEDKYHKSIERNFFSSADLVDFEDDTEGVRNSINKWAEKNTNYKIKELIAKDTLDPRTVMMLLNAIYFKGFWKNEFNKTNTAKETFHVDTKSTLQVPMMHQTDQFHCAKFNDLNAQVLRLPYQGERFSMLIYLPVEVDGLTGLENRMETRNVTDILNNLVYRKVTVTLPRFRIESTLPLEKPLTKVGLEAIFRPGADFSGITSEDIYVNKVIQKAFIEVNEEGTEAAAASGAGGVPTSLPPSPQIFTADHPFIFTIVDERKEAILFMGRVVRPM